MAKIKVLNLYAGLGGNRKLWPEDWEVTAVEIDPQIAAVYQKTFPHDRVVVGDAHDFLLKHYREYDFIWSSRPCVTHSRIRFMAVRRGSYEAVYPDLALYQEIIFLQHHFDGKYVVENVIPYYDALIKPTSMRGRHCFWANFPIPAEPCVNKAEQPIKQVSGSSSRFGFNIKDEEIDKRKDQVLRNMVDPELGLYVARCAFKERQVILA